MKTKEDFRKDFDATLKNIVDKFKNQASNLVDGKTLNDHVFDWIYNEVDLRDKELARWKSKYNAIATGCEAKISHLQSTLEAADEVLRLCASPREGYENQKYWDARKKYNQLKTKSQS